MTSKINEETFASAVVSSSTETDIDKLLALYITAIATAKNYNNTLSNKNVATISKKPDWLQSYPSSNQLICKARQWLQPLLGFLLYEDL